MITQKIVSLLLLVFATIFITACTNQGNTKDSSTTENTNSTTTIDEKLLNDKIKPLIKVSGTTIFIDQGEEYNLLEGITGLDNLEGDITDKIQINYGNYNKDVPGTYEIFYFLTDLAGNVADSVSRIINVRDTAIYAAPPIYTETIPNEKPAPSMPPYFPGAWYHKVVSSRDAWYGIEGTITLPEMKITRYENDDYNNELDVDPNAKNLDNPSIYMGGNATTESDIGLSLSKGCIDSECNTLSKGSFVFRPFWRYITNMDTDAGGYDVHNGEYAVSCTGTGATKNCIANWHYKDTKYYYLPGDKVRMLIYSPKPNYLQMQIEVLEISTLPESVRIREEYGWEAPQNFKSPIFSSPGHGTGAYAEYKRVNAIDQVSNEGKPTIDTTTEVKEAIWHNTYLYRKIDGIMYRVPLTSRRSVYINSPSDGGFTSIDNGLEVNGGEIISIHPGRINEE